LECPGQYLLSLPAPWGNSNMPYCMTLQHWREVHWSPPPQFLSHENPTGDVSLG
jgi:hypothetical protein